MYESLQMQYEELYLFLKENSRKSKVSSHYCSPQLRTCTTQREGRGERGGVETYKSGLGGALGS